MRGCGGLVEKTKKHEIAVRVLATQYNLIYISQIRWQSYRIRILIPMNGMLRYPEPVLERVALDEFGGFAGS